MKVFGIVGWKNSGKTGLMERLIIEITNRGHTVSTVKHAHHSFDVDHKGKDSHRHRVAGASEVLLSSRHRWALMHEVGDDDEAPLADLLVKISDVDLVLIEGYKTGNHAKLEAHRNETGNPLLCAGDRTIVGVASDTKLAGIDIPVLDLDDTSGLTDLVLSSVGLQSNKDAQTMPNATPGLANDCFALPPGVDWMPVDDALSALRESLSAVVGTEDVALAEAMQRVLATDVKAMRSNPPAPNSAVDGYGFSGGSLGDGAHQFKLVTGRSAAGAPYPEQVSAGHAVRTLTGAVLPAGVDTVVLQEDVTKQDGTISFNGTIKAGANTREAGEDVVSGAVVLGKGSCIKPQDIALLAAVGCPTVSVFKKLRVGVLSTGDEIVASGSDPSPSKTYDANRPMILGLVDKWGYTSVDFGHVGDDRAALKACLDQSGSNVDVILTSGGASAGEEDHVSALLSDAGALTNWRVAMKPGRPLAMGIWKGVPVIGLPGNPVAALVCTLIFGKPAMEKLSGGHWSAPQSFTVPAAFSKNKKAGRREYLRARLDANGHAIVFASEGSGRISGLGWADGLVELDDGARDVALGDPVKYIPYSSFGI